MLHHHATSLMLPQRIETHNTVTSPSCTHLRRSLRSKMAAPAGQPFNPMWKPPPPPPPVDQSNISPATYVRLISREGHAFFVDRECAKVSRLIKHYLVSLQQGNISGMSSVREVVMDDVQPEGGMITIRLPYTAAPLVEKTVQYFYFKHRYESDPENRPNFHVPHDMAVDLIKVATMLQC